MSAPDSAPATDEVTIIDPPAPTTPEPAPAPVEDTAAPEATNRISRALKLAFGHADPLSTEHSKLQAEVTNLRASTKAAHDRVAEVERLLAAASQYVATQSSVLAAKLNLTGDITAASLATAIDQRIAAQVATEIAQAGVPAAALPSSTASDPAELNISLAEFKKLKPAEQLAFSKSGGRITG